MKREDHVVRGLFFWVLVLSLLLNAFMFGLAF